MLIQNFKLSVYCIQDLMMGKFRNEHDYYLMLTGNDRIGYFSTK